MRISIFLLSLVIFVSCEHKYTLEGKYKHDNGVGNIGDIEISNSGSWIGYNLHYYLRNKTVPITVDLQSNIFRYEISFTDDRNQFVNLSLIGWIKQDTLVVEAKLKGVNSTQPPFEYVDRYIKYK